MATDYFRKTKSLYSSTSNSFGTGESETITPASVTGLPTDTEIVLTFDKDVAGKLERILGKIVGSNFTISSGGRGYDNTTEQVHTAPVVEYVWNAGDVNDQVTAWLVEHNAGGTHKSALVTTLKATGGVVNTGTSDVTIVTPKALTDSDYAKTTDIEVTPTSTNTLTNKRITPRIVTTTDDATAVIDCNITDQYQLTAVANATEFTVTGTPTAGQKLIIRVKDAGVAKALTFTGFTAIGCTIPTTTVQSKTTYVGCIYNATTPTWDVVAVVTEA
jgi:hypothetical protein